MDPAYDPDDLDKHLAPRYLYFWSYEFDGPAPCTGDGCLGMTRVFSKMSDQQLADVMDADCYWTQDGGQSTKTPQDDTYHSVCASDCISLTNAAIEGPVGEPGTLYVSTQYAFEAITTPVTATTPISYTWAPEPVSGQGTDSVTYTWATSGTKTITLTAENCGGPVTATRVITVEALPPGCPRPGERPPAGPVRSREIPVAALAKAKPEPSWLSNPASAGAFRISLEESAVKFSVAEFGNGMKWSLPVQPPLSMGIGMVW